MTAFRGCLVGALLVASTPTLLHAHNVEARYVEELAWHLPGIAHVYGMGYAELGRDFDVNGTTLQRVAGRDCAVGVMVAFDVDRRFAYDVDETIELELTYAPALTTTPLVVQWSRNGGTGRADTRVVPEAGAGLRTVTVRLERARFAKFGTRGVDLAISTTDDRDQGLPDGRIAVCGVVLRRPAPHVMPAADGRIRLRVIDAASGRPTPARVGLYDVAGRSPLPSAEALRVERFADHVRLLTVDPRAFWPTAERVAFYVGGDYHARVPAGHYTVVASHGPEYRVARGTVEIRPGRTGELTLRLERYADLPAAGWYSGDDHIHLARERVDDAGVWTQVAAEDVHVGNLLQMGNIAGTWFEQPAWGRAGRYARGGYVVASGQEDPRTGHLGHTIHENLSAPLHAPAAEYFLYHRVFDAAHAQGGLSGYAHLNAGWFNARRGLALDMPFGGIDFLEVFQAGRLAIDPWYDYLNLGFHVLPSAGSDFPYTDLPGVVRVYAQLDGGLDPDRWFDAVRAGRTYVTNGPFLEFTVNGQPMGAELRVPRGATLEIAARARLNPDVDGLDRIELVSGGEVVASARAGGRDHAELAVRRVAGHSEWLAVRAYGARQDEWNMTAAHTAPVYVVVDDEPTWKREAVPALVARQRALLQEVREAPLVPSEDLEAFVTAPALVREWPRQRALLEPRIRDADARYVELARRAAADGSAR